MFKALLYNFIKKKDGATAVEFAIIALPFMMMIFGIMEISRILWIQNGVEYVVKETARYASLNIDETDGIFKEYALDKLDGMKLPRSNLDLTSTTYTTNGINFVELNVTYTVESMFDVALLPFVNFSYNKSIRKPVIE